MVQHSNSPPGDSAPPAKRQRAEGRAEPAVLPLPTAPATPAAPPAVLVWVLQQQLRHAGIKLRIWKSRGAEFGAAFTEDATCPAISHVALPAELGAASWALLPPQLQPSSTTVPSGLAYVTHNWLVDSGSKRQRQPEAQYAPEPPHQWQQDQRQQEAQQQEAEAAAQRERLERLAYAASQLRVEPSRAVEAEGTFTLLTWNIWYHPICMEERAIAIGQVVCHEAPTFIALQEVTHASYEMFERHAWWRAYAASPPPPPGDGTGDGPNGCRCFTVVLARRDRVTGIEFPKHAEYSFSDVKRGMRRGIRSMRGSLEGREIRLSTTHLMHNYGGRREVTELSAVMRGTRVRNFIVAGDTNWLPHLGRLPLPDGWEDVWLRLCPGERGLTWHPAEMPQRGVVQTEGSRFDRVFCRLRDWQPELIRRVGRQPIPGLTRKVRTGTSDRSEREIAVWPSDHMGLIVHFTRIARHPAAT